MKYSIMIKILMTLLQRRKITAKELSDKYDVSRRTIYRYVEEMAVCGVPIEVTRGKYGGLTIADTFRLPNGYFTQSEYKVMLDAFDAMLSQINDENLISARAKIAEKHKKFVQETSVCGNIIVDSGTWSGSEGFTEKISVCEQAVNENRCVMIDYISRSGEHSKRIIDPHVLIYKQNVWYVYAYCHTKQEFRTFKIGRIKNATFTGAQFVKRNFTRKDLELNFRRKTEEMTETVLEIESGCVADVEEWLGIDNIEPKGKGFIATLSLPNDDMLVNKILGFGGAVKVAKPPELKAKVKSAAEKIANGI